jgi:hypothetical protein
MLLESIANHTTKGLLVEDNSNFLSRAVIDIVVLRSNRDILVQAAGVDVPVSAASSDDLVGLQVYVTIVR